MENTFEIKGSTYTEDELKEIYENIVQTVTEVWNKVIDFLYNVAKKAIELVKQFINHNPVGYKRLIKIGKLKQYENMSISKSNKWRKIHGLHLRRMVN